MKQISISHLRHQKGLVAYYTGKSLDLKSDEFVVVTIWSDLASLKAFAGEKWQEAVIANKEERETLKEWVLYHYESFE